MQTLTPGEIAALLDHADEWRRTLTVEQLAILNVFPPMERYFLLASQLSDIRCFIQWKDWIGLQHFLLYLEFTHESTVVQVEEIK